MNARNWSLTDDLEMFNMGDSGTRVGEYRGKQALHLNRTGSAVLLRDDLPFESFRMQAEVAIPDAVGFAGLVFGAKDSLNYELVYLAPVEIQYDPIMNGSMTWQIYNGPAYQKPLPNMTGRWTTLAAEVRPNGVKIYLGDDPEPQLVISRLQHGGAPGKIGVWGYLPSYIRNLSVVQIQPEHNAPSRIDLARLAAESYVTEWRISEPYAVSGQAEGWTQATVEENGTLNLNRHYKVRHGAVVLAESTFRLPEERQSTVTFGFSDHLRLWINEEPVYEGSWKWNPPVEDGRIRDGFASVNVCWKAGLNTIRAELSDSERFGWGLKLKTGLTGGNF